jgi:hypothetical protein
LVNGTIIEKYLWSGLTTLLAVYDGLTALKSRSIFTSQKNKSIPFLL